MNGGRPASLRFGDELDELRRDRGLSWEELARRANVSATYLKDIAAGRRGHGWPGEPIVEAVAAALGVEPDYFLLTRARVVLTEPDAVDVAYAVVKGGEVGQASGTRPAL